MRVQIISRDNGWGLSRDVSVLTAAIKKARPDAEVIFTDWQDVRNKGRFNLNVFLELLNPAFYQMADRNVMVPNPEWFVLEWLQHLRGITEVWTKTQDGYRIFKNHVKATKMIGWTSDDQYMPEVPRHVRMVHLAGASSAKGTEQVIEAMRSLPHHHLTLVSKKPWVVPANVDHHLELPHDSFRQLQNAARIHVCPSSYEGFGHYINEARSVGAVIITTNAEPMTDLLGPREHRYGFGAAIASVSNQNLAQHKHVSSVSLAEMIDMAARLPESVLASIGANARNAYLGDRATFETRIAEALA